MALDKGNEKRKPYLQLVFTASFLSRFPPGINGTVFVLSCLSLMCVYI